MTKPREKTREELTAEIEEGKKKIRQFENREKIIKQKLSVEERKARNHRLCKRGGFMESLVPELIAMPDEDAKAFLRLALMSEPAQEFLKKRAGDGNANQCRYHKIDGTPPGDHIREISMTADELGQLLGISEASAYELIGKGYFEKVDDLAKMRITKESFWKWYATQTFYRTVKDQAEDEKQKQDTYTMPEIGKMLGLHRNQVYYIVSKGVFEIVQIGRYKCITKDSFHSWYASQSRYTILASAAVQERSE